MEDALSTYTPSSGTFLRINSGEPVKIRVLTLNPGVIESSGVNTAGEEWTRTQYAFVIWNWDAKCAQIWTTTPGNLNKLTTIHRDPDLDAINKIDIKVSATGEMLEKRYEIMPLPKSGDITQSIVDQSSKLKVEDLKGYKGRLSEVDSERQSGYAKAKAKAAELKPEQEDEVVEFDEDEPINLDDIPF